MQNDDETRLRHMLDAAREAVSFSRGRTCDDLDNDRQLVLASVKEVEISAKRQRMLPKLHGRNYRRYRGLG